LLIGTIRDVADAIFELEPQFNDKIATLIMPPKGEELALTRSQFKTLVLLMLGPSRSASELGEAMGLTKASLTGILDALESKGLATRAVDGKDRRRNIVTLTQAGRDLCGAKMAEFESRLEARMSYLSDADRVDLARCLSGAAAILKKL